MKRYQVAGYARTDRNAILDVTSGDEIRDEQMRDMRQRIAEALGIERSGVRVDGTLHYVLELHDWVDGLPARIERALQVASGGGRKALKREDIDYCPGHVEAGIAALEGLEPGEEKEA